jgi:sugar O-acyltransferase (sialic acid O-acetyltransferase NeuD family)
MEPIILIGAGGHCISCIDILRLAKTFHIVGILDIHGKVGENLDGIEIIGTDDDIPLFAKKYKNFLISVGQIKSNEIRFRVFNTVKQNGGNLPFIVSPRAYVSPSAFIDEGTIIMHNALVNSKAVIGKNCIINTGALIEHEARIGDNCHISTHAIVNGQSIIGKNSFLGSNSVIGNNVSLPEGIILSAGACMLKSITTSGTYFGNPARKITN